MSYRSPLLAAALGALALAGCEERRFRPRRQLRELAERRRCAARRERGGHVAP